ncbi:MAG: 16S rRNA (guanine(527)-N(7))-methyltransferase RsmG [Paludibacteraceae bacterium]
MEQLLKYFPNLSERQKNQFLALYELYLDWNSKINVISRKDIENLYERHVLHSLGIAKTINFKAGSKVLDVGTGGGLPGIPLAVYFSNAHFTLIDSIGKKIKVAQEISSAIELKNSELKHCRIQEEKGKYDFIVSRAVMPLDDLVKLTKKNIASNQQNALPNGLVCLKGGELQREILPYKNIAEVYDLSKDFEGEFFKTKKVVYVPISTN